MNSVVIKQSQVVAQVVLYPSIPNFLPFLLTAATDGQTVFTLPGTPVAILLLAIQGVVQSQLAGDFTFSGTTLTLSSGVDAGTLIAGVYV
jgi:hypothetical protein